MNLNKINRALISVSDKSELAKILKILKKFKVEILSSGCTYKKINRLGFKSIEISDFTNSPEILDGRVKTCLLYTSPSPRDATLSRMPSSA